MKIILELKEDSANSYAGEIELTKTKGNINITVYGPERTLVVNRDLLLAAAKAL